MKRQKHPLIAGTLILTATGVVTRFIGFFYKIFLSRAIGAEGLGIYQMIFPVYGVCYALTTAGAEIAVTRFVSCEAGKGNLKKARYALHMGLFFSLSLSLLAMLLLYAGADLIAARLLQDPRCASLLRLLSVTVPFGACHSCICGYYYGLKRAGIPAAAHLAEQLARVGSMLLIYRVALSEGRTLTPIYAVTGLVIGEFASMLFCLFCIGAGRPSRGKRSRRDYSLASLARGMALTALPITGNRICMNLLASAEAALIPFTLRQYGLSTERALSIYGTLTGMSMSFILFPNVLTNAVSVMLLPAVSESQAAGRQDQIRRTLQKTLSFCLPMGAAFTVIFLLSGKFLGAFFFQSSLAGDFIITLAWICPFLYLNGTLHSILNGLGKTGPAFFNNLAGLMIRIVFILLFVPRVGIEGYLWGLLANQLFVTLLNLGILREYLTFARPS